MGTRHGHGTMLEHQSDKIARTPYNFVSLPYMAVPAPLDQELGWEETEQEDVREFYKDYILENGELDGYIELTITTKTPCFIGGCGNEFFAPVDPHKPMIPGSTIRGMVKNIFKIITCGTMRCDGDVETDFHDQRLYYRSMASTVASFKNYYKEQLHIEDHVTANGLHYSTTEAQSGFLVTDKLGNYFICPAKNSRPLLNCEKTNEVVWDKSNGSCECYNGPMPTKKHYDIIFDGEWECPLIVPDDVVKAYKNDRKRGNADGNPEKDNGFNLLTHAKDGTFSDEFTQHHYVTVVPCFYMPDKDNKVKHFGFGRYYRVPYKTTIREHVPEGVQRQVIDYADSVFGKTELWGSRVYFDDALLQGEMNAFDHENYTHPLMTPNPTSFQLYLEQQGREPAHWDSPSNPDIRGYKMYWHKRGLVKWEIDKNREKEIPGMHPIRPLKQNNVFKGRIRFKDLSAIELGALLKVFALGNDDDDEMYYKLGQGKSLGMGSVKIETELHIYDRQTAYTTLLDDDGWQKAESVKDAKDYIEAFEVQMEETFDELDQADKKNNVRRKGSHKARYEILQRELCRMLDWKKRPKDDKTDMMKIDDPDKPFQNRFVLPTALDDYYGKK